MTVGLARFTTPPEDGGTPRAHCGGHVNPCGCDKCNTQCGSWLPLPSHKEEYEREHDA